MEEIIKQGEGGLSTLITETDIGDIIKPLTNEIHLFDTFIAGTSHLEDRSVLEEIKAGDRLVLQREDNKYDKKAILTLTEDGKKLGYIPEKDNIIFSRLMDAGKLLIAKIEAVEPRTSYYKIQIKIFLVDF